MLDNERYIFEQSMLAYEVYKVLSKVTFKKGTSSPPVQDAIRHLSIILDSKDSMFSKNQDSIYSTYTRFRSDYLENEGAFTFTSDIVRENREMYYNALTGYIIDILSSLQDSLNSYTGSNQDIRMLGQTAMLLLKGLYFKGRLKTIIKYVPKAKDKGEAHPLTCDYYIDHIPESVDTMLTDMSRVAYAGTVDNCVTTLNTVCDDTIVSNFREQLEKIVITKSQAKLRDEAVSAGYSNMDEGLKKILEDKGKFLYDNLPSSMELYVENTITLELKSAVDDIKHYLDIVKSMADYPEYYTGKGKIVESQKEETTLDSKTISNIEPVKEKKVRVRPHIDIGEKILYILQLIGGALLTPLRWLGYLFRKIGRGIASFFRAIGSFFATIGKGIARLVVRHKVVAIILAVVLVATPVVLVIVLHQPCLYDSGVVVTASTCDTHGVARIKCLVHSSEYKDITLPLKHNVGSDNLCLTCGESVSLHEDKYIPDSIHSSEYKCIYGMMKYDTFTTVSHDESGRGFEKIEFDSVEARVATIYTHADLVITFNESCKIDTLEIVGSVDSIQISGNSVKNIIVCGNISTLSVQDYTKLGYLVIDGSVQKIVADTYGKIVYLSKYSVITSGMIESDTIERVYVAEDHELYTCIDSVVYNKAATTLVYYPRNRQSDTLTLPSAMTDVSSLALSLEGAKNLKTIVYPDSVTTAYINYSNVPSVRNLVFGSSVDTIYYSQTTSMDSITFGTSHTYDYYRKHNGSYTVLEDTPWTSGEGASNAAFFNSLDHSYKFVKK